MTNSELNTKLLFTILAISEDFDMVLVWQQAFALLILYLFFSMLYQKKWRAAYNASTAQYVALSAEFNTMRENYIALSAEFDTMRENYIALTLENRMLIEDRYDNFVLVQMIQRNEYVSRHESMRRRQ